MVNGKNNSMNNSTGNSKNTGTQNGTRRIKVSFFFPGNVVTKPIVYHMVKDFDLIVNILHADIGINKAGKLTADIEGESGKIEAALKFIEDEGIEYKLFNKTIIWQEDACVHCGACTAVCPTGALRMDSGGDWSLTFDKEKCLVCELCLKACPLRVMSITF
jgi:L-aspartate semialdehyde sulfurtransferase ferredoxin